jgi:hypothetical protein
VAAFAPSRVKVDGNTAANSTAPAAGLELFPGSVVPASDQRGPFNLGILNHSPWIEERGVSRTGQEVRVDFNVALDPSSVGAWSIHLGYRDNLHAFREVPSAVVVEGDRRVLLRPLTPLWPAVYYEVRVRGGKHGIRDQLGVPLAEDYRWRFATQVEFQSPPLAPPVVATAPPSLFRTVSVKPGEDTFAAVQQQACQRPSSGATGAAYALVHVFQSVCDAALLPGKTTMIQAYAVWYAKPEVGAEHQVQSLKAQVEFSHETTLVGAIEHTFMRTDSRGYRLSQRGGTHTARLFGWKPEDTGGASSRVRVTVKPVEGPDPRPTPAERSLEWARSRLGRASLTLHLFSYTFTGRTDWAPPSEAALRGLAESTAEYVAQTFPLYQVNTEVHAPGSITIGPRGNPRSQSGWVWDATTLDGGTETRSVNGDLYQHLVAAADEAGLVRERDIVIGVVPPGVLPVGIAATKTQPCKTFALKHLSDQEVTLWCNRQVILTPVNIIGTTPMPAHVMAHEIGHYHGLLHCPWDSGACRSRDAANRCRDNPCVIEGYRLDQRTATGWNKSTQEGNAESATLESMMWYQVNNHNPDGSPLNTGATNEQRFVSLDSYRSLLEWFTDWSPSSQTGTAIPPWNAPVSGRNLAHLAALKETSDGGWTPTPGCGLRSPSVEHPQWQVMPVNHPRPSRPASPSAQPLAQGRVTLVVHGFVRPDGSGASIDRVYTLAASDSGDGTRPVEPALERHVVEGIAVEMVAADDSVLARSPVIVAVDPVNPNPAGAPAVPFAVHFQRVPLTSRVIVRGTGRILAERTRSPAAPTVALLSPANGATLDEQSEIRWRGSDTDGDALTYEVHARRGPADGWTILASGTVATSLTVAATPLAAGPAPEIRVVARDGFNASAPASARVTVRRPLRSIVTAPAAADSGVPVDASVRVGFTSELDPRSVTASRMILQRSGGAAVPATVSVDDSGRWIVLTPTQPLRPATTYVARARSGIADRWGNSLAAEHSWTFTTAADEVPPWVVESVPAPGALTVRPETEIRVLFSEPLSPTSVQAANVRISDSSGAPITGSVRWDSASTNLVFRPGNPLPRRTRFSVTITGVRDESGNALPEPHVFTFTTAGSILPLRGPDGRLP